jgi:hypothetical protein
MNLQSIKRSIVGLFFEMAPTVLFFFVAFMLMGVLFKLFVSRYQIEFSAFARAAVAALVVGKVILLVDWAESNRKLSSHRRIVAIAGKTLVYALAVLVFGVGEKIFEAARKAHSVGGGVHDLIANANMDRFIGLVLLISMIVFFYLLMQEVESALGEGGLFRLLFKLPEPAPESHLSQNRSSMQ